MSSLPLSDIINRYHELNTKLSQASDTQEIISLSKEQKKLQIQYDLAIKLVDLQDRIVKNNDLLATLAPEDQELLEMTQEEIEHDSSSSKILENELLTHLNPSDPKDDNDILIEIRAGAGGDESALFAAEMLRMYTKMAEQLGLKVSPISTSMNELGGYKEIIAEIRGEGSYSWYKYESGVHRVQRVPATEKQGRIHTSTVSVAIMPLLEDNSDFKLDPKDIHFEATTSSGKGGQSVNTTYSAVKLRHIPTGIEAQSQDERSQVQNKIKCLAVLTSRVFDYYEQKRLEEESSLRREQVGRADRSEKVRTYNFPQDRLTDHRYNYNWNQLPMIMDGAILHVITDIKRMAAEEALKNL